MATCPKCQLPNPDSTEGCIWCGRHTFSAADEPAVVADAASAPTPIPESRPLSSHSNLILTPVVLTPVPKGASTEARTLAATPAALAQQHAVTTPVPSDTPVLQAKLVVIRGQRINQEFPLYPGRNMMGRFADRPVDIDLSVQEAEGQVWSSRQHAVITMDRTVLVLEDLNSLNGTWLNGARITAGTKRPLQPSDIIQIGTVQLKLVIE